MMAGLLDILGGNFGTDDPRQAAYLALASGLLSGRGNFGQVAGQALQGAQGTFQEARKAQMMAQQQAQQAELTKAQMDKLRADAEYRKSLAAKGIDLNVPADIQKYEYVKKLPAEERAAFERVQRQAKIFEMNGIQYFMDPVRGPVPLTDLDTQASAEAAIAGARQRAQEREKASFELVRMFNPESKKEELRPRIDLLPPRFGAPQLPPQEGPLQSKDPNLMARLIADAQKSGDKSFDFNIGGNKGSVTVPGAAPLSPDTPEAKLQQATATGAGAEGGKTGIQLAEKLYDTATKASKAIPRVDELISLLESGNVHTGLAAELKLGLSRAQSLLGGKAGARLASNTQIIDVLMGSEVFPLIQSLGIGARGMDTPAEREFMRKVLTGDITLETDTLLKMARLRKKAFQESIEEFNRKSDGGELDTFFSTTGINKRRLGTPAAPGDGLPAMSEIEAELKRRGR